MLHLSDSTHKFFYVISQETISGMVSIKKKCQRRKKWKGRVIMLENFLCKICHFWFRNVCLYSCNMLFKLKMNFVGRLPADKHFLMTLLLQCDPTVLLYTSYTSCFSVSLCIFYEQQVSHRGFQALFSKFQTHDWGSRLGCSKTHKTLHPSLNC